MQNDIATIDALKKGASYAQEELVRCYMERVRNLIFAIVQNMQDAEELTQDTFLAVFKNVCRYDVTGTTLASLVYRIAYNKALSFLKRHRLQLVPLNEDTIESAWSVYSTGEDYAEDDEGKKYDIEVQTSKYSAYKLRTLHYWARKYAGQIKSGEHYPELKPVISINIMGYKLIKETDKYHTCFQIREKDNRDIVLTDVFEMHFIELSKCAEQIEEAAINIHDPMETLEYAKKLLDIERWIWFFRYGGTEDKIMQAIAAIDETIGKANAKFREYTEEEWAEWEREAHQIYLLDREAIEEEIRQESRAEGSLAAKVETARNMLAEDFSIEQIAKLTGLSLSEVKKLKAED